MKQVRLNLDDKLYYRIKACGYSYNELLAFGIRLKQIFDIFEGREKYEKDKPQMQAQEQGIIEKKV